MLKDKDKFGGYFALFNGWDVLNVDDNLVEVDRLSPVFWVNNNVEIRVLIEIIPTFRRGRSSAYRAKASPAGDKWRITGASHD